MKRHVLKFSSHIETNFLTKGFSENKDRKSMKFNALDYSCSFSCKD